MERLLGKDGKRLREHPEWSDRRIANKLVCDHKTVEPVRQELESGAQIGHLDRLLGEDGKWYRNRRKADAPEPGVKARKPAASPTGKRAKALAVITQAAKRAWRKRR